MERVRKLGSDDRVKNSSRYFVKNLLFLSEDVVSEVEGFEMSI